MNRDREMNTDRERRICLSLFADDVSCIRDPRNSTRKLLEMLHTFYLAGYRINLNKPITFLYSNSKHRGDHGCNSKHRGEEPQLPNWLHLVNDESHNDPKWGTLKSLSRSNSIAGEGAATQPSSFKLVWVDMWNKELIRNVDRRKEMGQHGTQRE